jgi:predicted nuclease of predicted toxin-antitoxin system
LSKPRILADENIPKTAIQILRNSSFDVIPVWEIRPGLSDDDVVNIAVSEGRIILTFDKDFGRYALTNPNIPGVILIRIPPKSPEYIAQRVLAVLATIEDLHNKLIIVRRKTIKIIRIR